MDKQPKRRVPLQKKALDLLSRRRLSRGELKDKLLTRGYEESEIDSLLDRFEELGYLDDESLAFDYAVGRLAVLPMGRKRLRAELLKRRIPEELATAAADEAFSKTSEEWTAEKAHEAVLRSTKARNKVWGKLSRLGFPYDVIETVMSRNEPESGYE